MRTDTARKKFKIEIDDTDFYFQNSSRVRKMIGLNRRIIMPEIQVPTKLEKLCERVENHEGVLTVTMAQVRDAYGSGRLGIHVREGISQELQRLGVGHYPRKLPDSQDQDVRLYTLGSPVAELIKAVLRVSHEADELLRKAAGGDAAKTLQKVKELVCD